jgi:hypothetical protein
MKKLVLFLILLSCSCVNGKFEIPEQTDQDKTGQVNLIQLDF